MEKQVLIPAASLIDVEMPSTEDVTNRSVDRVCVPWKSVQRKNGKKKEINRKLVTTRQQVSENKVTEKKTENNASSATVCGDANHSEHKNPNGKSLKRKATTDDQSENGIEQEKGGVIRAENRNFKEKGDSTTRPSRKTARKEKSYQKIEDYPKTIDENARRNVKKNKSCNAKISESKPLVESEASDDEEENLALSDKEFDLYILGSLILPKKVLKVCIQTVKGPSGASLNEIYEQIKTATKVKPDYIKQSVGKFLRKGFESRLLQKYTSHRYKI